MTRKLAIISTSNAIADVVGRDYSPSKKLLKLLEEGYEVVMITTRERLSDIDQGWLPLIKPENIYFPIGEFSRGDATDPAFIKSWEAVFNRFGLTPPFSRGNPNWLAYRRAAEKQGVVI